MNQNEAEMDLGQVLRKLIKWKTIRYLLFIIILTSCQYHPTQHGQQYTNGQLPRLLNLAQPHLNRPINIDSYLQQVKLIEQYSPSLFNQNKAVYNAINQWIIEGLATNQFNFVGLSSYQLQGQDKWGNVHLTGYYTPVMKGRRTPQGRYRYPLYAKPRNFSTRLPSRLEIYDGALDGQKLEIAYTDSLIDNFIMEVQGSGFIDFEDGSPPIFFGYNGKNGHPYKSIGRLLIEQGKFQRGKVSMQAIKAWAKEQDEQVVKNLLIQNASTVFFEPQQHALVIGSTGVPLIARASVASDQSIIPAGSVLLVDIPLLDDKGIYQGQRELRLMIALDIGGAIKGQHLDIYQGIGEQAGNLAGYYNHYGRVWLLAPPKNSHLLSPVLTRT